MIVIKDIVSDNHFRKTMALMYRILLAGALLCLLDAFPVPAAQGEKSLANHNAQKTAYTMGIFPYLPATVLEDVFSPLAAEIGQSLGREVRFISASSMRDFTAHLKHKEYEIAYIQPFDYALFAAPADYLPLVTRFEELFAVFVVTDGSPLHKPADLMGKTVGSPPAEGAVYNLAKIALQRAGLKPDRDVTIKALSTQESCFQQLQIGNIDVCASGPAVVRTYQEQANVKFRIIMESPKVPPNLFVANTRVLKNERAIIAKTLTSTNISRNNPGLKKLFVDDKSNPGQYFRTVKASEYDIMRRHLKVLKEMR